MKLKKKKKFTIPKTSDNFFLFAFKNKTNPTHQKKYWSTNRTRKTKSQNTKPKKNRKKASLGNLLLFVIREGQFPFSAVSAAFCTFLYRDSACLEFHTIKKKKTNIAHALVESVFVVGYLGLLLYSLHTKKENRREKIPHH